MLKKMLRNNPFFPLTNVQFFVNVRCSFYEGFIIIDDLHYTTSLYALVIIRFLVYGSNQNSQDMCMLKSQNCSKPYLLNVLTLF